MCIITQNNRACQSISTAIRRRSSIHEICNLKELEDEFLDANSNSKRTSNNNIRKYYFNEPQLQIKCQRMLSEIDAFMAPSTPKCGYSTHFNNTKHQLDIGEEDFEKSVFDTNIDSLLIPDLDDDDDDDDDEYDEVERPSLRIIMKKQRSLTCT